MWIVFLYFYTLCGKREISFYFVPGCGKLLKKMIKYVYLNLLIGGDLFDLIGQFLAGIEGQL